MMIKKKEKFVEKNELDANVTENSFTQAVKKAGSGGARKAKTETEGAEAGDEQEIPLKAYDDLMRAKEAKNDTSVEGAKYRREEQNKSN